MDLKSRLFSELRGGDEQLARKAASGIASLGEGILPELERMLSDASEDERWWAVRVLAEIDHPEATRLLKEGLHDERDSVRQCAALAFRKRPHPGAAAALIQLLDAQDSLTRRLAGDALIALGPDGVTPLLEVMEKGATRARVEAARALAKLADTRAVPALFHALDDESALLAYWAEEGLDRMGVGMVFFHSGSGK